MKNEPKKGLALNEAIELKPLNLSPKNEEKQQQGILIYSPKAEHPHIHYTELIEKDQRNRITKQENTNQINLKDQEIRQNDKIEAKNKKPKLPTMKAKCNSCKKVQIVSAKKEQFKCQFCGERSSCNPIYGVISCSSCDKKVLYMRGVATMIRCTNCSTINIINQMQKTGQKQEEQNQ